MFALVLATVTHAVPAYPGWQTKTLQDGSEIKVRQLGDEFYHYWVTEDGLLAVEQADGSFVKSSEPLPTMEEFKSRRDKIRASKITVPDNGPHKLKK